MTIRNLQASNISELRNIVNKVPTTLRDLARAERRELIKMEAIQPNSASYVISRGGLHNNVELANALAN